MNWCMCMAKNPRLVRLIDLVPFITSHQGIAFDDLAAKFSVSKDELKKDLELLWMCGLPDYTPLELMDFSFEDGYVSVRNAEQLSHPRTLTQDEIAALLIGLDLIDSENDSIIKSLKEKLASKLQANVSYSPTDADRYFVDLNRAIQESFIVRIKYSGKVREVIPFEIYKEHGHNYLRGYCKQADARRTFKLTKISELEITEIKELAPNIVPSSGISNLAQIKTHKNARLVRESLGNTETVNYFSKDWLIGEVMSLAGACELLDPQLRAEILSKAVASKNLYLG